MTFPLEQLSKDPHSVIYTGLYDTEGVAHTKSGERQPVQTNIQVLKTLNLLQKVLSKYINKNIIKYSTLPEGMYIAHQLSCQSCRLRSSDEKCWSCSGFGQTL